MSREKELSPEQFPFCLEAAIGEVVSVRELCPGVYYAAAKRQEHAFLADEYYVVEEATPAISKEAKSYGKKVPEEPRVLLYPYAGEKSGYKIIEYEVGRYQIRNQPSADKSAELRSIAVYNMEYHPDYFGTYPVPLDTPRGRTLRHKVLMNGLYWLETDSGEEVLAVCYPIWNCDLSEAVIRLSEQTEEDRRAGIDNTLGYLFFSKRAGGLALFELWEGYKELRGCGRINSPALMNHIWTYYPEYAVAYNVQDQMGMYDACGLLLRAIGLNVELECNPDGAVIFSETAGLDFLTF